jgi:hypothetical protein
MSSALSNFIVKCDSSETKSIVVSEVCLAYHSVNHHLSYRSTDCGNKLIHNLFTDSKIAKGLRCGRTKMEAIVKNVLSPASIESHLNKIRGKAFSIASDASNKGNIKLFPIGIQYFDKTNGICNFVLDFYEDSNEKSDAIYNQLKKSLGNNELNQNQVIAYSADNANVNYGNYHSVYENFKSENNFIVKANCNCHVIHNTAKYSLMKLDLDVENLIIKVFAHFSNSAKRVESLKSCYEFSETEFQKILKHVPTRWLSLFPAIKRLLKNSKEIKNYFIGIGTDNCHKVIVEFVWGAKINGLNSSDLYLEFTKNLMEIFHQNLELLQSNKVNSSNLYDIMMKLKTQLTNRREQKFFGSNINDYLKNISVSERETFEYEALECYDRALDYLEKHFNFESSIFKHFKSLNLDDKLVYENINQILNVLNMKVNRDKIFDEISSFNQFLTLLNSEDKALNSVNKWCKILSALDLPNLTKVIETVYAIPIANDFIESVFSTMKKVWKDDRSRINVDTIKAEIWVEVHFRSTG